MPDLFLTIKEIAKRLEVPESNIRYYRDRFDDFIPSVGQGRRRRYKQEALDVFAHIIQAYRNEKSTEQIASDLAVTFPRAVHVENQEASHPPSTQMMSIGKESGGHHLAYAVLQAQAKSLEQLTHALSQQSNLATEFSRLEQEQKRLKKGLVRLWHQQGTCLRPESQVETETMQSLQQDVQALEQRLSRVEKGVQQELQAIRQELKECLELTREVMHCLSSHEY